MNSSLSNRADESPMTRKATRAKVAFLEDANSSVGVIALSSKQNQKLAGSGDNQRRLSFQRGSVARSISPFASMLEETGGASTRKSLVAEARASRVSARRSRAMSREPPGSREPSRERAMSAVSSSTAMTEQRSRMKSIVMPAAPLIISKQVFDEILDDLEDGLSKIENPDIKASMVKLSRAELDFLKNVEKARDFLNQILDCPTRDDLFEIFCERGCVRICRARAIVEVATFSNMNAKDPRPQNFLRACEMCEKVLISEFGCEDELKSTLEQQRRLHNRKLAALKKLQMVSWSMASLAASVHKRKMAFESPGEAQAGTLAKASPPKKTTKSPKFEADEEEQEDDARRGAPFAMATTVMAPSCGRGSTTSGMSQTLSANKFQEDFLGRPVPLGRDDDDEDEAGSHDSGVRDAGEEDFLGRPIAPGKVDGGSDEAKTEKAPPVGLAEQQPAAEITATDGSAASSSSSPADATVAAGSTSAGAASASTAAVAASSPVGAAASATPAAPSAAALAVGEASGGGSIIAATTEEPAVSSSFAQASMSDLSSNNMQPAAVEEEAATAAVTAAAATTGIATATTTAPPPPATTATSAAPATSDNSSNAAQAASAAPSPAQAEKNAASASASASLPAIAQPGVADAEAEESSTAAPPAPAPSPTPATVPGAPPAQKEMTATRDPREANLGEGAKDVPEEERIEPAPAEAETAGTAGTAGIAASSSSDQQNGASAAPEKAAPDSSGEATKTSAASAQKGAAVSPSPSTSSTTAPSPSPSPSQSPSPSPVASADLVSATKQSSGGETSKTQASGADSSPAANEDPTLDPDAPYDAESGDEGGAIEMEQEEYRLVWKPQPSRAWCELICCCRHAEGRPRIKLQVD